MKQVSRLLAVVLTAGLLVGCGANPKAGEEGLDGGAGGGLGGGGTLGRLGGGASDLGGGAGGGGAGMADENRVYFEYDSSIVNESGRQSLAAHARRLQGGGRVTIEGHCDERGTREYNLALGQKRADAAKHYLVSQGVPANRIQTVSYGKERALVSGHDDFAWSKNRRAEIIVNP